MRSISRDLPGTAKDALDLALNKAPFINLWYARAALDWLLLLHVREMLLPSALRRMERKLKKAFGQGNAIPPSRLCAYGQRG